MGRKGRGDEANGKELMSLGMLVMCPNHRGLLKYTDISSQWWSAPSLPHPRPPPSRLLDYFYIAATQWRKLDNGRDFGRGHPKGKQDVSGGSVPPVKSRCQDGGRRNWQKGRKVTGRAEGLEIAAERGIRKLGGNDKAVKMRSLKEKLGTPWLLLA